VPRKRENAKRTQTQINAKAAKTRSERARAPDASARLLRNRTSAQLAEDRKQTRPHEQLTSAEDNIEGVGRGPLALRQRAEAA
jgi:hypothetical protein